MKPQDAITEKSLIFLESVFNSAKRAPRHAYPISTLPYPKETIKKALKKYISSFDSHPSSGSLEDTLSFHVVKGLYLSLADFMDDADALFVNKILDVSDMSPQFKDRNEREHYEKIIKTAEKEREDLNKGISVSTPSFSVLNLLSIV